MMIVAFGKSFSVSDPTPKKLIMNTLARAAIERDRAMEDGEENVEDNISVPEVDNKQKEPKKGISVTRALVMLGFNDWKDLEPG